MKRLGSALCLACMVCHSGWAQSAEQKRHDTLAAAKLLEEQDDWKDAEQSYLDLLKSDPAAAPEVADALNRIRPRLFGKRWAEAFDRDAANAGRVLLVVSVLAIISITVRAIVKARRSIQFLPFLASTDGGAKQIAFWLARSHAELTSPSEPFVFSPALTMSLPLLLLPNQMPPLAPPLSEVPEFEIAGFKLKPFTLVLALPRVRVSGGWMVGSTSGSAYAQIELRRGMGFESHSVIDRPIESAPGTGQDRDLRLFAYDVLMKASGAFER